MAQREAYTRRIAEYVTGTQFQELPPEAIAAAKLHILDGLGIALRAYRTGEPLLRALIELAAPGREGDRATILGDGRQVTALDAAMVNGVLTNFLDFSDGHFMGGHINDRLLPVALAAAELAGASGRDLLVAVALGYEVYIDLASALFGRG